MSHRKSDLGIPCPQKICQSRARPCTHKIRLNVRFSPKATELPDASEMTRCATSGCEQSQQSSRLFDHLVGAHEECRGYGEAKRLRSLEVENQFGFRRLHDRQLLRPFSLENPAGIDAD